MKSLPTLLLFISFVFVLSCSKCKKCEAPAIAFDPASASVDKNPGDKYTINIVVTGDKDNISSIIVSKTSNGSTNSSFISITGIGSKNKTVAIVDSVPVSGISYGSTITYAVTATSDCKKATADTKTLTITIRPSSVKLDYLYYEVTNTTAPRIYSHFTSDPNTYPTAWDLQGRKGVPATGTNSANADKDICDSSTGATSATPFATVTRWGSRNGTRFVKAASGFDYTNASAKSIVDAYNAGTSSNLITYTSTDYIIVNIKNSGKYAVVKIKQIFDDGPAGEDYTFLAYKLAQL